MLTSDPEPPRRPFPSPFCPPTPEARFPVGVPPVLESALAKPRPLSPSVPEEGHLSPPSSPPGQPWLPGKGRCRRPGWTRPPRLCCSRSGADSCSRCTADGAPRCPHAGQTGRLTALPGGSAWQELPLVLHVSVFPFAGTGTSEGG